MQALSCDVAIIGSGLAGLSAALVCANKGLRVLVCAKSNPGSGSCTAISQGHFRASVPGFSPQEHRHLTLEAGQGLNQAQTVDILVHRAEKAVRELETCGVRLQSRAKGFDTHPDRIGGEGVQITKPLVTCARSAGVTFLTPFHAWRMVTIQGHAAGVLGFRGPEEEPTCVHAGAVILATGGAGALFARTDNPQAMTGSGYALAHHAGLDLTDMEFIQFYPLCLATSSRTSRLLPPVLGEIGTLNNAQREDIAHKHAVQPRPLAIAARDKLCQAMMLEVSQGRGHDGAIALDLPQDKSTWKKVGQAMGITDIDPLREWIAQKLASRDFLPVLPAAHFCMGGVIVDQDCETALPGLLAAGEVVGGLHGANRYGGNALSEAVVFGQIAGEQATQVVGQRGDRTGSHNDALNWCRETLQGLTGRTGHDQGLNSHVLKRQLQDIMWREAGVIRSQASLERAWKGLEELKAACPGPGEKGKGLVSYLTAMDSILIAEAIVQSALFRRESRGAHMRSDFPESSPEWSGHTLLGQNGVRFSANM